MKPLNMAVIGVGALGRHHARILSQMGGVNLVAVCDANPQQGQTVADSCGCRYVADYRDVLDEVDAVCVVVPTFSHRPVAVECFGRGVAVLVEKPLAANVADGEAIVRAANAAHRPLQVGHIERFNPAYQALAEACGEPKYIRAERLSPYAFRSMDISAIHDLMIHDIELCLHLAASPADRVEAFGICILGGQTDCVQARIRFENGCIADLVANRVSPVVKRSVQVWSAQGCTTADLQARTVTQFAPGQRLSAGELPFELASRPDADVASLKEEIFRSFIEETQLHVATEVDALTAELSAFVDTVRSGGAPQVDGAQGLSALEVAERIEQGVESHRWTGSPFGWAGPHAHPIHRRSAA